MSNKVQSALDAREARRKKELQDKNSKVTNALEARKQRNAQNKDEYLSAFYDKLTSELEATKEISDLSFGYDSFKTAVETTRDRRLAVDQLRKDADAYRTYLGDEVADELLSGIESLAGSYDSYLKSAEFYSQFKDEDDYNQWKKIQDEIEEVTSAEDFEHYSQIGANIKNPSAKEAEPKIILFGKPIGGQEVGNVVTYSRDQGVALGFGEANGGGSYAGGRYIYNFLEDNEVAIYNYYLGKGDKAKAQEFLTSLEDTLQQRHAGKIVEGADDTALELVFSAVAGIGQAMQGFRNLDNFVMGTEVTDTVDATTYAHSAMSSNNTGIWKVANDLTNTTAHMLPSVLVGSLTGGVGGALTLGASAVGNAYAEMRNDGYNEWQSRGYAFLVGLSEGLLQYFLGGIKALGGKLTGKAVTNLVSKFDNAIAKTAIKLGGNMISEGAEEAIQSILEPAFKRLATGEDFEAAEWEDVWYSALLGALSAGALEGVPSIATDASSRIQAKKTYADGGKALVDAGVEAGGLAQSIAEKYKGQMKSGKKLSGTKLLNLEEAIHNQDVPTVKDTVKARLTEVGEKGNVDKLADILTKQAMGEDLNTIERAILHNSDNGYMVMSELFPQNQGKGLKGTEWVGKIETKLGKARANTHINIIQDREKEQKATDAVIKQLTELGESGDLNTLAKAILKQSKGEKLSLAESKALRDSTNGYLMVSKLLPENSSGKGDTWVREVRGESLYDVSDDGNTIRTTADGTPTNVNIKGIASNKNGTLMLTLDDGSTVKASELDYGSSREAIAYEMVTRMGTDVETSQALVDIFKDIPNETAEAYGIDIPLAYKYGRINYEAGLANMDIPAEVAKIAFNRGRIDAVAESKAKTPTTKPNTDKPKKAAPSKKNGIVYESGFVYDENTATEIQRNSMKVIEMISDISNLEVHVFASKMVNGKRVATINGKEVSAPNGYYKNGNQIYIDINAGNKGEGAMLYTMSHEVSHYIREWNADGFRELGDFLIEQFGKQGVSVQRLLNAQINKIKNRYNAEKKALPSEEKLFDMAYEELVADAMSDMLADETSYIKLAELKKQNKTLWEKFGEAIKQFLDKLKSYLGIYKETDAPVPNEAYHVRQMASDVYNKLQDLYLKAFVEADANYEASIGTRKLSDFAEAVNENGEPLLQYRAMEADEDTYRQMLHKWGKMSAVQIDNLFATIDEAMELIKDNLEILDYAWEADIDDRAFSPVKPNSDKLYQVSLDFSTLCRKRILQQTVAGQLQEALNKPLTREEGIAIRDALMALQEEGRQIEVACALCYVESARMKSPAQIKKFMANKEKVIKEFFAGKSGGSIKDKIKQAEVDAKEKLHKENPNGILGKDGKTMLDPRTASLKQLPKKYADAIRDAKRTAKESYKPTAEEQELIDIAKKMTVSDFTSPEGLENLAKKYPSLFDAYTSYIRNATKSKGIEGDTWWRAGDSQKIGDVLIANMNEENGLRSQSWSDFQVIHILDYIASTIELATRNTKEQAYSKVPDYVELMGNTGVMINMSLIPTATFNGSLEYDSVEGIDYKRALKLRDKYHATAGTICIGVDNAQIKLLLADATIDYVIPYHKSGMSKALRKLMHLPTWSDYEAYQSESKLSRADAEKQAKKYGVKLLDASDPNYQKGTSFSEWFDLKEAQQIAKLENANPTDKAKQKKYGVMYGGYMAMQNAANNYLKLCAERGLTPKFSHENADFTAEENYWKLLIDRKMVDNVTGDVIEQQTIKPIFDQGEVMRILNDELDRYPKVKADQDYAIRTVTEKMLSGEIKGGMSAEAIAKVMKKPVDNVTNVNILASAEDMKLSDRDYSYKNLYASDYYTNGKIYSYDFLTVQKDIIAVELPKTGALADRNGKIDDAKVVSEGIKNALSEGVERDGKVYVENVYTGRELRIDNSTIKHGLDGTYNRHLTNARIGSVIGSVVKNAIPINGLKNTSETAIGTYAMVSYCHDSQNRQFVAVVTVEQHTGNVDSFELYDVAHAVSGRQKKGSQVDTKSQGVYPIEATTISIAHLLEIVNSTHQSILSEDVLNHFGETRKANGSYSDKVLFSDRDSYAPTFYSHMGKVIDDIKLDKMGAGGVVSYLKGRGVKDEEIKWSGIEAFLEGKKSVTKAELQEFVAGSQLQIEEEMSGEDIDLRYDGSKRAYNLYDSSGKVIDTFTYNQFLDGYVADSDEEIYSNDIELREALRDAYGAVAAPKWAEYRLDGGTNYRELVFKMPNSTYSNRAMRGHWGQDAEGILVHARVQDFDVNGKKMLFIEELQSDWHNEGMQKGYSTPEYEDAVAVYDRLAEDYSNKRRAFNQYVRSSEFRSDPDEVGKKKFDWLRSKMETAEKRMQDAVLPSGLHKSL